MHRCTTGCDVHAGQTSAAALVQSVLNTGEVESLVNAVLDRLCGSAENKRSVAVLTQCAAVATVRGGLRAAEGGLSVVPLNAMGHAVQCTRVATHDAV